MTLPIPTGFPPSDNLYKFVALTGIILILAPGIFWVEQNNILEERVFELSQKIAKNNLNAKHLSEDIEELGKELKTTTPSSQAVISVIVGALKTSSFSIKIPESQMEEIEELESKVKNPNISRLELIDLMNLFVDKIKKLKDLNLSPKKDFENFFETFRNLLHIISIENLRDLQEIRSESKSQFQGNRQLILLSEENRITSLQLDRLRYKITFLMVISLVFVFVGIFLTFWGFYNWYTKIQIIQDGLLKNKKDS